MAIIRIAAALVMACLATATFAASDSDGVVEIRAVGMKFEGPAEIPSGWTTFRFSNSSNMVHFAMIDDPPGDITAATMAETTGPAFQGVMDAMNANDPERVDAAFGKFPAWLGDMAYRGGPGFLSGGLTSATTVYLEPGYYVLECYVKTAGVFHTTSPAPGTLGMLHELTVTDADSGNAEPTATVTVDIRNSGLSLAGGAFAAGPNVIRVNVIEQQTFPSFVGNDVHIVRLDSPGQLAEAAAWMDWRKPDGLETPAPVTFLGGINDMPAGSHGYIHVDLAPGNYALIGETPEPLEQGFTLPFTIDKEAP